MRSSSTSALIGGLIVDLGRMLYYFFLLCFVSVVFTLPSVLNALTIDEYVRGITSFDESFKPGTVRTPFRLVPSTMTQSSLWVNTQFHIYEKFARERQFTRVLGVSAGSTVPLFPHSTHVIHLRDSESQHMDIESSGTVTEWTIDIERDAIPVEDDYFDLVVCVNALQDMDDPVHAFNELTRVAKNGIIISPSVLISTLNWEQFGSLGMRGHPRHRYLLWTNSSGDHDNYDLVALPKFPLLDHILPTVLGSDELEEGGALLVTHMLPLHYDHYWWSDPSAQAYIPLNDTSSALDSEGNTVSTASAETLKLNRRKGKMRVLQYDIHYNFSSMFAHDGYSKLIRNGVGASIESTLSYSSEFSDPMRKYSIVEKDFSTR